MEVAVNTYNKTYYEKYKNKVPCEFCGKLLTEIELKRGKKSRHYINHCKANPNKLYKDRKQGNFKKQKTLEERKLIFKNMYNFLVNIHKMYYDDLFKKYENEINFFIK